MKIWNTYWNTKYFVNKTLRAIAFFSWFPKYLYCLYLYWALSHFFLTNDIGRFRLIREFPVLPCLSGLLNKSSSQSKKEKPMFSCNLKQLDATYAYNVFLFNFFFWKCSTIMVYSQLRSCGFERSNRTYQEISCERLK